MPDFGAAFSGPAHDRNPTHAELVSAIGFMVAAEHEAIKLHTQLAQSTDDGLARKVLVDIADEERVHAGEFLRLLHHLAPDFSIRLMVWGAGLRMGRSFLFQRVQSELKSGSLGPILPNLSSRCLRYDLSTSVASWLMKA